jgi:ATP-dependent helicase/nuclease subunit B
VLTGGEKSRFITQLEIEGKHQLTNKVITPAVPKLIQDPITIEKTPEVIDIIKNVAEKGFSPSSLTNYIRNPIDFYYQKILKIKEYDDAEETVASNTLGTVIHNTLEDFYQPLINTVLTIEHIQSMKSNIDKTVTHHFKSVYKEGDISKGKNLIVFEIAKRYISNFLNLEISDIKAGNQIKIIDIERDSSISLNISELDFPIKINGKVDRVDSYNGITRIIDYKTGKVLQNEVEIIDWEDITSDYKKYSKSFQILTYVLMMLESKQIQLPVKAGIISFKNLKSGILQFSKKDKPGQYSKKNNDISAETLDYFKKELTNLIIEICNPDIPFIEKET